MTTSSSSLLMSSPSLQPLSSLAQNGLPIDPARSSSCLIFPSSQPYPTSRPLFLNFFHFIQQRGRPCPIRPYDTLLFASDLLVLCTYRLWTIARLLWPVIRPVTNGLAKYHKWETKTTSLNIYEFTSIRQSTIISLLDNVSNLWASMTLIISTSPKSDDKGLFSI